MFDFRHRKIRRLFIVMVASLLVGMLLASAYALRLIYQQKIENGQELALIQARVFEDYLTQSFNNIDLTLRNAPIIWQSGLPASDAFELALHNAPYLRSLSLIDPQGTVIASSNQENIGERINLANFLPRVAPSNETMRFGRPWVGRDLHDGHVILPSESAPPDALAFLPIVKNARIQKVSATVNR